ncbi:MAG: YggS family pyridoxal phosphate-dependent enzyme [Gammaproteobacteria bacterium]
MPNNSNNISLIESNLEHVLENIRNLEKKYQRQTNSVQLLAVSKTKPINDVLLAHTCGQHHFGENYVQEAVEKIEISKSEKPSLHWHFIGPVQKNKTRLIAENFQWVHSVDRLVIAQRLNDQRLNSSPPLQICIQVNIDDETSKSGVSVDGIQSLAKDIVKLKRIKLRGLMAIPQASGDTQQQRKSFSKLRQQLEHLNQNGFMLDTLSMGMSGDLEAAIAEGATIVRIGTSIFGKRTI